MMKILKRLFYVIIALAAVVLIIAVFLPKKARIESSIKIGISPDKAFHMIATYSNRAEWDPWAETDSTAEITVENKEGFIGSKYSWKGEKIGSGNEVIDSVDFGKHVKTTLSFDGMDSKSVSEWNFVPSDDSTLVRWSFETEGGYPLGRIALSLMKNQLKTSFDKGLTNLKTYLEKNGYLISTLTGVEITEYPAVQAMGVKARVKMTDMQTVIPELMNTLMTEVPAENLILAGPPFIHYYNFNQQTNETEMIIAMPVQNTGKGNDRVKPLKYPVRKVLKALHTGPYTELHESYNQLMKYAADNKITTKWESFETYMNDPSRETNPIKWQTEIAFLLE